MKNFKNTNGTKIYVDPPGTPPKNVVHILINELVIEILKTFYETKYGERPVAVPDVIWIDREIKAFGVYEDGNWRKRRRYDDDKLLNVRLTGNRNFYLFCEDMKISPKLEE